MIRQSLWTSLIVLLAAIVLHYSSYAQAAAPTEMEGAYLDPPYQGMVPLKQQTQRGFVSPRAGYLPSRSNVESVIANQTPVRAQGARGTCSIFSATGLLESLLVSRKHLARDIDLSEEWLQYVNSYVSNGQGSNSWRNFQMITQYGMPPEPLMPYIAEDWKNLNQTPLSWNRCANVPMELQQRCLAGHRDPRLMDAQDWQLENMNSGFYDPEFLTARQNAFAMRANYLNAVGTDYFVMGSDAIKTLLNAGVPLVIDLNFYYGAWNHPMADGLGIGRDLFNWEQGIVGYPEYGSADYANTPMSPAGHSFVLVGYDDNRVVTTQVLMNNGMYAQFTYRGVYYFKNSWGTQGFGSRFEIGGIPHPGYGMITQRYAEEYGSFMQLPLN